MRKGAAALLAALAMGFVGCSGVEKVHMKLPMKPRIPLKGNEKVGIAPFIIVTEAEKPQDKSDLARIDVQAEFHRYLIRELKKKSKLQVVDLGEDVKLPTRDLIELSRSTPFWKSLGQKAGVDIVVSGSLEFRIEDRTGYKSEEYVSPINGQTYYRQIYVEQTGFLFDLVLLVLDGRTGDRLLQDEFKDFRERNRRRADELTGLFENLFTLEEQVLNIFVPRERPVERYLFTR
jgi:hypothetical protein